jgi:hypothetical protein
LWLTLLNYWLLLFVFCCVCYVCDFQIGELDLTRFIVLGCQSDGIGWHVLSWFSINIYCLNIVLVPYYLEFTILVSVIV